MCIDAVEQDVSIRTVDQLRCVVASNLVAALILNARRQRFTYPFLPECPFARTLRRGLHTPFFCRRRRILLLGWLKILKSHNKWFLLTYCTSHEKATCFENSLEGRHMPRCELALTRCFSIVSTYNCLTAQCQFQFAHSNDNMSPSQPKAAHPIPRSQPRPESSFDAAVAQQKGQLAKMQRFNAPVASQNKWRAFNQSTLPATTTTPATNVASFSSPSTPQTALAPPRWAATQLRPPPKQGL